MSNIKRVLCQCGKWVGGADWPNHYNPAERHLALSAEYITPIPCNGEHDGPSPWEARVHTGATVGLD